MSAEIQENLHDKSTGISNGTYMAIFSYLLFCVIGATKQVLVNDFGWSLFWFLRCASFFVSVIIIVSSFSKKTNSLNVEKVRYKYSYGDPLLLYRSVACIMVLLQHGYGINFAPANIKKEIWGYGLWLLQPSGWVGVWFFFVLSGYLMGKGFFCGQYLLDRANVLGYYRNRFLKIAPMYIIVVILSSVILEPQIFEYKNLWMLLSILLFDYDGTIPLNPNGALWSIATEMQFYVIAPVLALIMVRLFDGKRRFWYLLSFMIIIAYGMVYRTVGYIGGGYYWKTAVFTSLLGNIDLFLIGFLLSYVIRRVKISVEWFSVSIGLVMILIAYVLSCFVVSSILTGADILPAFAYYGPIISGLVGGAVIVVFEVSALYDKKQNIIISKVVGSLQLFGVLTYNIYLMHEPIQRLIAQKVQGHSLTSMESIGLVLGSIVIVFMISLMVDKTIDKKMYYLRFKGVS